MVTMLYLHSSDIITQADEDRLQAQLDYTLRLLRTVSAETEHALARDLEERRADPEKIANFYPPFDTTQLCAARARLIKQATHYATILYAAGVLTLADLHNISAGQV